MEGHPKVRWVMEIALFSLLIASVVISGYFMWTHDKKLAQIHILTNSGMKAALVATVVALRNDAVTKHRLAEMTKPEADSAAAAYADGAVREAEKLVEIHELKQPK